jgi:drug/metabolite transporter (DMT)-like permease
MPASALAFALSAAVFHALWNMLLARARDVEAATAVAVVTAAVVFAPVAAAVWQADSGVWPWVAGSSVLELAYFALLAAAYRRAPLSVVYPVARGGAPVLVLAISVLALGHTTSARQVLAVALIVLGIVLVRGLAHPDAAGVAFGVAIACCIAGYTLVDKHGIVHAAPIPYLELTMVLPSVAYAGAILRVKGRAAVRRAIGPAPVVAGISTFVAYAFVLAALERASAASVAAVRETSVVIATVGAAVFLGERVRPHRLLGAVLVATGIALLGF